MFVIGWLLSSLTSLWVAAGTIFDFACHSTMSLMDKSPSFLPFSNPFHQADTYHTDCLTHPAPNISPVHAFHRGLMYWLTSYLALCYCWPSAELPISPVPLISHFLFNIALSLPLFPVCLTLVIPYSSPSNRLLSTSTIYITLVNSSSNCCNSIIFNFCISCSFIIPFYSFLYKLYAHIYKYTSIRNNSPI